MDFTNQSFKMAFQNKIDAVDTNETLSMMKFKWNYH